MRGAKPKAQEKAAPPQGSAAEPLHSRSYFAELIFWAFMYDAQAARMLPLLISVLTFPISLDMAILPGPSGMVDIAALVLAMFSPEHAVAVAFGFVFAKAGVKARAKEAAAMIKILIGPP